MFQSDCFLQACPLGCTDFLGGAIIWTRAGCRGIFECNRRKVRCALALQPCEARVAACAVRWDDVGEAAAVVVLACTHAASVRHQKACDEHEVAPAARPEILRARDGRGENDVLDP